MEEFILSKKLSKDIEKEHPYPGITLKRHRCCYMPCDPIPPYVSYDQLMTYLNKMNELENNNISMNEKEREIAKITNEYNNNSWRAQVTGE